MSNTLTKPNVIKVQRAIVYTDNNGVTVSTSATLLSLFSGVYNKVKNIVITPPKGAVRKIDMIGETASTAGNTLTFQNYLINEDPFELAKLTGTLLLDIDEDNFDTMAGGAGTAVVTASYTEYQYGASNSGKTRLQGAI